MPIQGLTDDIIPRYPRIGSLRKGGEKTAAGFGEDLDHFRFTSPNPEIARAFAELYPGKPRAIRVVIPHDTVENAFATWCELWSKTGLVHRCDGKVMNIWREGAKYVRGAKACPGGHKDDDPRRDSVGRLEFIIPNLVERGFVGYISLTTHSLNDILNISRVLAAVYRSMGTLAGVEFLLSRVKENISVPGWGDRKNDRARADKWLVRLEPSVEWVKKQLDSSRRQALSFDAPRTLGAPAIPAGLPTLPAPSLLPSANSDLADDGNPGASWVDESPIATVEQPPAKGVPGNGHAPEARPSPKAKTASIKVTMQRWNEFCQNFAGQYPHYLNEEGKPDKWHIGAAAVVCGFPVVSDDNFESATAALIHRAQEQHPAPV